MSRRGSSWREKRKRSFVDLEERASQLRETRVVLLCAIGTGNTGNDQSLLTAMKLLSEARPGTRFRVSSPHVEGAQELLGVPVIPIRQNKTTYIGLSNRATIIRAIIRGELRRIVKMRRLLKSADIIMVTGTGIFDDFGEKPWTMPYALVTWAAVCRAMNRPFVFTAVGAGPVDNALCRWQFAAAARLAASVSYRDSGSQRFMAEIGVKRDDTRVVPDIVFATERAIARPANPYSERITVGVGVMAYGGWSAPAAAGPIYEDYVQCISDAVVQMLHAGHAVKLLVGQPCDIQMVDDVMARCGAAASQIGVPEITDFPALLRAVGETDVVVATRYHNIVAALMMKRPVVSLSYAPKNQDLLASMGVDDFNCPIESANAEWILERLELIRSGQSGFDSRAWDSVAAWPSQARKEIDWVLALVG